MKGRVGFIHLELARARFPGLRFLWDIAACVKLSFDVIVLNPYIQLWIWIIFMSDDLQFLKQQREHVLLPAIISS